MSASLARAAPIRFLIGVVATWTVVRGVAIAGWAPSPAAIPGVSVPQAQRIVQPSRPFASLPSAEDDRSAFADAAPAGLHSGALTGKTGFGALRQTYTEPPRSTLDDRPGEERSPVLPAYSPADAHVYAQSTGIVEANAVTGDASAASRFSGSAWAFVRGGGRAAPLSPVGQIGGGQAGARLLYRIDDAGRLAAAARISRTIGGVRQTEAAVGIDWKPLDSLPVHLMLDRRIAIDRGGRNAWTLGMTGGVDDVRIARGWRLDGYAEAGVVGVQRRDLYADGAARIARAIDLGGGRSLAVGGGLWGAAQPNAARLDAGPSAVLRTPVAGHVVAVALDWRERVAGAARPGSGVALTVATDF